MNQKQLLATFGLKWNPFSCELPDEALITTPAIDDFLWRVESLIMDGGFALVTGESGLGKSVILRLLERRLSQLKEVKVAEFARPQSGLSDFYRELGYLFGIELRISNRWGGFKSLREQWKAHIESSLFRPVLMIDEAQEMPHLVLSELRLLASMHFDSEAVLCIILGGDNRLQEKLRSRDLIPLGTRIRTRLHLESYSKEALTDLLTKSLTLAGAAKLMTKALINTLVEHANGNPRIMNALANEVLMLGLKKEVQMLDEHLFIETLPVKKRAL